VAESDDHRLRSIEQAQQAAAELGRGRDGTWLAPPEIRTQVAEWKQRLDACERELDEEGWLIGLLTLACLPPRPDSGQAG
jgi:hypothetical protein